MRAPERACTDVSGPILCNRIAATAATWGAAAEVPQKGFQSGRLVATQSAPVRSGLRRTSIEGMNSVTGPCELKGSMVAGSSAGAAATVSTSGTAEWPKIAPDGL